MKKNKIVREDWDAPQIEIKFNTLTETEKIICHQEIKAGADIAKLARYFNTTEQEVINAVLQGEIMDERNEEN